MIRQLRVRFVTIAVLLAALVLAAVLTTVGISARNQVLAEAEKALRMELLRGEDEEPFRFRVEHRPANFPQERQPTTPTFSVTLNAQGRITATNTRNVDVEQDVVEEAVRQVLEKGSEKGMLSNPALCFLVEPGAGGTRVAFAAMDSAMASLRGTWFSLAMAGLGSLMAFLVIALLLARVALAPVERTWEQQRRFVADASHELKTPLTVMLANTSIIAAHRDSTVAEQETWLENTREEALRMKKLVDDLLYLAQSDDARVPMEKERVCLSDAVVNCLLSFEPVAYEAGVALDSDVEPDVYVTGDENRLKQLLTILLDNACKYAGTAGRMRVEMETRQGRAHLRVNNTGEPIPTEKLGHVFERFYRVDPARAGQGGHGLGLAIAKDIVLRHEGKIAVQSDAASGTTFTVAFPLA